MGVGVFNALDDTSNCPVLGYLCHAKIEEEDANNPKIDPNDRKAVAVDLGEKLRTLVKSIVGGKVFAAGDSYNDTGMLGEADQGFFFCAPENVVNDFPQFPLVTDYDTLLSKLKEANDALA